MSSAATDPAATGAAAAPPAVELRGITKRFPGVVANSDVHLSLHAGEVHAVVGENGAGKSTLMKTMYGMHQPDEGTILVDGVEHVLRSPSDAIALGIGMVHQHFMLADNLTVLENIVLGSEPRRGLRLDVATARTRIEISAATAWACARTTRWPGCPSPTGSAWRSPRSSTAARAPSSSTSPPPCSSRRRSTRSSPRSPSSRRGPGRRVHLAQARRGPRGRRPHHRHPPRDHRRHGPAGATTPASSPR